MEELTINGAASGPVSTALAVAVAHLVNGLVLALRQPRAQPMWKQRGHNPGYAEAWTKNP